MKLKYLQNLPILQVSKEGRSSLSRAGGKTKVSSEPSYFTGK